MDVDTFRLGVRLGTPYAAVALVLSASFSVLAVQAGFTPVQAIVTSALVFAGSAQFTALTIVVGGGSIPAALSAAALMHSRFLAMGIAVAPSLKGGRLRRAVEGQAVVDSSWALANRGDGTYDRALLFGTTLPQYVAWTAGAVAGAYSGDVFADTERLGLDALFPTFFVGILLAELRQPRARVVAALGAVIAIALVPIAPPGVPVLAAGVAALLGLGAARPAPEDREPGPEPGPGSGRGPG